MNNWFNKKEIMFNSLFEEIKTEMAMPHMANIMGEISILLSHFTPEYLKHEDSKDKAIDAVCEILKAHKDV